MDNLIKKLYSTIDKYGINSREALVVSRKLDLLIAKKQENIYMNYKVLLKTNSVYMQFGMDKFNKV